MDFMYPDPEQEPQTIPELLTPQTASLRNGYPSIEHLEAGNTASWLQERRDQLWEIARSIEIESDSSKVIGLIVAGLGTVLHATSPFASIGVAIAGAAYLWTVIEDYHHTKNFTPIPLIRGSFFDFLSAMGDSEERGKYFVNYDVETVKFLNRQDRMEYAMLHDQFEIVCSYLNQIESGKRFHAYRWIRQIFSRYKDLPSPQALQTYIKEVTPDTRINYQQVTAIQDRPRFIDLPTSKGVDLPPAPGIDRPMVSASPEPGGGATPDLNAMLQHPIPQRAAAIVQCLIQSGFQIDAVMDSQVIAIAGTQRGGKGTLAGILTCRELQT